MPSPFPGMSPYLEQNDTWEDFHANFITRAQEVLSGQVGPHKTPGPDRDDYLAERRQVLVGTTHLVEIDLRRGGTRPNLPELPRCDS